jgi:hypothetical protein
MESTKPNCTKKTPSAKGFVVSCCSLLIDRNNDKLSKQTSLRTVLLTLTVIGTYCCFHTGMKLENPRGNFNPHLGQRKACVRI